MRGTEAGFAVLVKAAEAASEALNKRPEVGAILCVLAEWNIDPDQATDFEIRAAQSYVLMLKRSVE